MVGMDSTDPDYGKHIREQVSEWAKFRNIHFSSLSFIFIFENLNRYFVDDLSR